MLNIVRLEAPQNTINFFETPCIHIKDTLIKRGIGE